MRDRDRFGRLKDKAPLPGIDLEVGRAVPGIGCPLDVDRCVVGPAQRHEAVADVQAVRRRQVRHPLHPRRPELLGKERRQRRHQLDGHVRRVPLPLQRMVRERHTDGLRPIAQLRRLAERHDVVRRAVDDRQRRLAGFEVVHLVVEAAPEVHHKGDVGTIVGRVVGTAARRARDVRVGQEERRDRAGRRAADDDAVGVQAVRRRVRPQPAHGLAGVGDGGRDAVAGDVALVQAVADRHRYVAAAGHLLRVDARFELFVAGDESAAEQEDEDGAGRGGVTGRLVDVQLEVDGAAGGLVDGSGVGEVVRAGDAVEGEVDVAGGGCWLGVGRWGSGGQGVGGEEGQRGEGRDASDAGRGERARVGRHAGMIRRRDPDANSARRGSEGPWLHRPPTPPTSHHGAERLGVHDRLL